MFVVMPACWSQALTSDVPALFSGRSSDPLWIILLIGVIAFLATSARRSRLRCSKCRELNRESAIFCAQCGTRLKDK